MTSTSSRLSRSSPPVIERASPTDRAFLTAIIDPDHFPDPATVTDALHAELDQIIGHPAVPQ